jgi:rare lipoprotein A
MVLRSGAAICVVVAMIGVYSSVSRARLVDYDQTNLQVAAAGPAISGIASIHIVQDIDQAAQKPLLESDMIPQLGPPQFKPSCGKDYRPAFALVMSADKQAVVKINDVGPLEPGRVIDLNERTMRYFDPALQHGLIPIRVTPCLTMIGYPDRSKTANARPIGLRPSRTYLRHGFVSPCASSLLIGYQRGPQLSAFN